MGQKKAKGKEEAFEEKKEADKAKELKDKKGFAPKKKKMIEGVRGIVRIAEIDVEGDKKLKNAILKIKGVGKSLSKAFIVASKLEPDAMIGTLNDDQIRTLEDVMKSPMKYGIPYHMLNRIADPQTNETHHLISSELTFAIKSDIDSMKKMRSYKGVRHELGQPVRGQRTRSSFRTGTQVGVVKKKLVPGAAPAAAGGAAPAAAPAKKEEKK
jgi:small subunit ribosomal protein S13